MTTAGGPRAFSVQSVRLKPASYASHATDFSLSRIVTDTIASTDPHRTDRIIGNAYMRCVLMTSYGMRMMRVYGRLPLLLTDRTASETTSHRALAASRRRAVSKVTASDVSRSKKEN
uniref:SFRICE_016827 n=1 Tax=Spodoptera frugiperda TaxID=7108 RepID=A0A2H1VWZ8_SPOFR